LEKTQKTDSSINANYANDFTFIEVPEPLANINPTYKLVEMDEPLVGKPFKDFHFQTVLTRVTPTGKIRNEYSRFDPFNRDQSMIILVDLEMAEIKVYRTATIPYTQPANLVCSLRYPISELRWDPNDPNVAWGVQDFSVLKFDVKSCKETVIKDFRQDKKIGPILKAEPSLYRITDKNEGESSQDKRFWAFFLQGTDGDRPNLLSDKMRYIFTWDRQEDRVLGIYKIAANESELDWVGMSPLGNYVLIGGLSYNGGNLAGLVMAPKNLDPASFHRLDHGIAHSDIGLDINGREVIVMSAGPNNIDMIPIDYATKPIFPGDTDYTGTNRTPLVHTYVNWNDPDNSVVSGTHISCNVPGYCVISTDTEVGKEEKNWLDRVNLLVRLDPQKPRAFYLSKIYNTPDTYWEQNLTTISNDGSKVIWATNWNDVDANEEFFLLQLDLPSNWRELTGSETSKK
jgi:hypothetical protein